MQVDSVRELHNLGKNLSFVRLFNLEKIQDTLSTPTFSNITDIINYTWQVK